MLNKIQSILKKVIITVCCITTVGYSIISVIPIAKADSSGILGTNASLGSPILNNNATVDNWNKWEMICWGVFLSNFCQPLIDDYTTAFTKCNEGSNGAGYQALCFGSGNDETNNETIQSFCDYALNIEKSTAERELKVVWATFDSNGKITIPDPDTNTTDVETATFRDLFFEKNEDKANDGSPQTSLHNKTFMETNGAFTWPVFISDNYLNQLGFTEKTSIPVFYIKKGTSWEKVYDYTNPWDIQMTAAILNAMHTSDDEDAFGKAFDAAWDNDPIIAMDTFGNIVISGTKKMIIPASANQHITTEPSINLINSFIMNSYTTTTSREKMQLGLRAQGHSSIPLLHSVNLIDNLGGYPAFQNTTVGNIGLLYYDTDSIALTDKSQTYGEIITQLFDAGISANQDHNFNLKFEIAGSGLPVYHGVLDKYDALSTTVLAASILPNVFTVNNQPKVLNYIIKPNGEHAPLIGDDPIIIPVMLKESDVADEPTAQGAITALYNYMFDVWTGDSIETTSGSISKSSIESIFNQSTKAEDMRDLIKKYVFEPFKSANPDYNEKSVKLNGTWGTFWDYLNNESISDETSRVCLVYPVSDTMRGVASVLDLHDGTEFKTMSTMIYMTYLDFYGVTETTTLTSGTEKRSGFNENIFTENLDVLNVDLATLMETQSDESTQEEVLQMSYLMLSPEKGRSYRKELIYNGVSDFLYEQYNRITYGGSDTVYSGSASKSNSGFLAVEAYSDNWLTSWFLDAYVDIAVWMIGVCLVLIVIIGLMKGRKISWYFMCIFTVISVVLLVPSSGDIVPYVTSSFVQTMFSKHMTYWSMSEGIANAQLEADAASSSDDLDNLSGNESSEVLSLVKQLNVVFLDRSLMLKQDTSQKLTQALGGVYTQAQNLQSARWVLPMIMQQFSADDEQSKDDYVYIKLSNSLDDASVLYWYFDPDDASYVTTKTQTSDAFVSGQKAVVALDREKYDDRTNYFSDYTDVDNWAYDTNTDINYANFSYTINNEHKLSPHLYSFLLPDQSRQAKGAYSLFGTDYENFEDVDSWQLYIDSVNTTGSQSSWETTLVDSTNNYAGSGFEDIADKYSRSDTTTLKAGYSYYRSTESPLYYFFNTVKDSFESDITYGAIIGRLQGEVEDSIIADENGDPIQTRSNFMYATKTSGDETQTAGKVDNADVEYTPYVRDVLDLQQFFTNVTPYMYEMTLSAGGFDGESGILEDLKITDESDYYEGMNQSWAYRCNWAVKLMENPSYSKPMSVRDKDNNTYKIKYPILPDSYPDERPMVFSEAQMEAYGLEEGDLNLVELKCIKVNDEVAKKWTLLLNYSGTSGITKEVLYRQMALDATNIFCQEFSSGGVLDNMYGLYPQSIDLRYLSFDSVMKLLMLNVSKDTSYVYGDTMSTLLEQSDLITAVLLLIDAYICSYLIPFMRTLLLALIFYLGFIAILRALFSSAKYKGKIACGQLISNLLFMAYTLAYYGCFCALMSLSSSDQVLTDKSVETSAGNPVWVLVVILVFSCVYVFIMWKQICFCFAHFRDMGFEMYSTIAGAVTAKLGETIGNVKENVSNFFGGNESSNSYSTGNTNSIKGVGIKDNGTQDVNIKQASGGGVIYTNVSSEDNEAPDDIYSTPYSTDGESYDEGGVSSSDIDAEISAGEHIDND